MEKRSFGKFHFVAHTGGESVGGVSCQPLSGKLNASDKEIVAARERGGDLSVSPTYCRAVGLGDLCQGGEVSANSYASPQSATHNLTELP